MLNSVRRTFYLPGGFGQACYISNMPSYFPNTITTGGPLLVLYWGRHLLFSEMQPQIAKMLISGSGSSLNVDNPVPVTLAWPRHTKVLRCEVEFTVSSQLQHCKVLYSIIVGVIC